MPLAKPAGRLRKRITIQKRAPTAPNEFGEAVPLWGDLCMVWGEVTPLSGRELYAAQQIVPEVSHRVDIRHPGTLAPNLGPDYRLTLYGGTRVMNILSVLNMEERNTTVTMLCTEPVYLTAEGGSSVAVGGFTGTVGG